VKGKNGKKKHNGVLVCPGEFGPGGLSVTGNHVGFESYDGTPFCDWMGISFDDPGEMNEFVDWYNANHPSQAHN